LTVTLLRLFAVLAIILTVLLLIVFVLPRDTFSAPLVSGNCKLTQHELPVSAVVTPPSVEIGYGGLC
jgi:hypothetical protein